MGSRKIKQSEVSKMNITTVKRNKGERFGARKYATIESSTIEGQTYKVAKFRVWYKYHYTYKCLCLHHFFRQKKCKHIVEFMQAEIKRGK